jgi:hypothetical protein
LDIRIGIADHPRELTIELSEDTDRDNIKASVDAALSGEAPTLWLTDIKGRDVGVPSGRLAWVEIGPSSSYPIGFS